MCEHFLKVSLRREDFSRTIGLPTGLLLAANRVEEDGVYSNPVISSGIDLGLPLFPLHYRVSNLIYKIFFETHKNLKIIVKETWNQVWSKE